MDSLPLSASIRDLAFILFKRKWSILAILIMGSVLALGYLLLIREDLYTSVGKVLVKVGHEQAPPPTVLGNAPDVVSFRINEVNSEIDILTSTDLIESLVDKFELGKERPKEPPQNWIPWLKYMVKDVVMKTIKDQVDRVLIMAGFRRELGWKEKGMEMVFRGLHAQAAMEESNVIAVSLTLPYPPEKKDPNAVEEEGAPHKYHSAQGFLLSEHLNNYLNFRGKAYANPSAVDFFQAEVEKSQERLDEAEARRDAFEREHNIAQIEEQKRSLIEHTAQARQVLDAAQREYDRAKLKIEMLESSRSGDEVDFGLLGEFDPHSFPENLLDRLTTLQLEREVLRMSDTDESPRIQTNRAQFDRVFALIGSHLRSVTDEKQRLLEVAREQHDHLVSELGKLHANERHWRGLVRESTSLEGTLQFYTKKLEEGSATVARDLSTAGNVSVIQHPLDPIMPSGIRKTYLLLAALMGSVLAAVAWASIAEFFDHRVFSSEQLEKYVRAPVLAVIPRDAGIRRGLNH